ncbi:MAG: YbhB/YbcL family Raf kinase inhibitor-like protein [Methanothrix sp.]|nr:YbhB/YbcL family Raf kinase inhibitor-like protein [Methanothrix sp.]
MKSIISIKAVLAAFAISVLFISAAQAGEMDMKSLVVRLGFDRIPDQYTCKGINVSPEIEIQGLNATSVAVIVNDSDAPSGTFTHWLIWNIPPVEVIPKAIAKNSTIIEPFSAVQGKNDFGKIGYAGPCPPPGKPHRYLFRVFGLDSMLTLPAGSSVNDLEKAMQGHVLQKGEAVAIFGR